MGPSERNRRIIEEIGRSLDNPQEADWWDEDEEHGISEDDPDRLYDEARDREMCEDE